mgnify:CR=1 FL=1
MEKKQCRVCSKDKPLSDFPLRRGKSDTWCKLCQKEYKKAYWKENREAIAEKRKDTYEQNRDKYLSQMKEYYRSLDPNDVREKGWRNKLKTQFGMSVEDYDLLLEEQGGVCAICRQKETQKHKGRIIRMAVDHCHDTGEVRGLLCRACNTGIGLLGHDTERLTAAIQYLDQRVAVDHK